MAAIKNNQILSDILYKLGQLESFDTNILQKLHSLEEKVDIIDKRTESYPKLYDNVDKLVGEILENRQERFFIGKRLENHEGRIIKLEKKY